MAAWNKTGHVGKSVQFDVTTAVENWEADGLISAEQAQQMLADLRVTTAAPSAQPVSAPKGHIPSLVIEALGYLGGAIVVVALGLFVSYFWTGISTVAQLCVIAAIFVILLAAGAAVPQRLGGPAIRLRSVLWLVATVAWAILIGFAADNFFNLHDEPMAATAAWSTIPLAAGLWYLHREPLQHIGFFFTLAIATGVSAYLLSNPDPESSFEVWPGVAVWVVSLTWFALAWIDRIRPAELGIAIGAIGATFAAMMSVENPALAVMGVVMLAGFVVGAVARRDFVLLAIAALATLQLLPSVMLTYFTGILFAALVLLVVGLTLVGAAIYIARRRHRTGRHEPADIDLRDVEDLRDDQPLSSAPAEDRQIR